jgi:single-stranded-DNA-specific exonuclease
MMPETDAQPEHPLSLQKAKWVLPDVSLDDVQAITREHDIPELIARILKLRGIAADDITGFLNPTLRDHFPDPNTLIGMDKAVELTAAALTGDRQIAIFGDFDVDGATSSAILHRYLKACGHESPIYIPDRMKEGYGPNIDALKLLKDSGADLVFLLDCGTTAFDIVQQGRDIGLDIIILDHHEAEDELPAANVVVNPKRKDDISGLDMLAACGVTFLFCVALNSRLRNESYFKNKSLQAPNVKSLLDVLAMGTVCDMVPLTSVNRLFVRHGLKMMGSTENTGIRALSEVAKIQPPFDPYHMGFVFGPRINAGSRINKADLGARLLTTEDHEDARNIAFTLEDCNTKRKDIQRQMEEHAMRLVEERGLDKNNCILVGHEDWHPGLSGLVAGALKEKYKKPACVIAYVKTGSKTGGGLEGRGSGRSIPGIHIAQAFIDARTDGLITKGGGHAMAGGFTSAPDQEEALAAFLDDHVTKQMQSTDTQITTRIDAIVTVRGATLDMVRMTQDQLGPFGQGFEEPLFLFQGVRLNHVDVVGGAHIRIQISDWEGGSRMKVMAFRAVDTDMGQALLNHKSGTPVDIVGQLKINDWQGRQSVEMHLRDAKV